jgi:uncharacterized protein YneF (UPF0154 family)
MKLVCDSTVLVITIMLLMTLGGIFVGMYIENSIITSSAIKHNCGNINKETGNFEWTNESKP